MQNRQDMLNVLKSREMSDEASILDTIAFLSAHIDVIRAEESKAAIEQMAVALILLHKHPSPLVRQAAVYCLSEHFLEETRAIEQQVIAIRIKKGLSPH